MTTTIMQSLIEFFRRSPKLAITLGVIALVLVGGLVVLSTGSYPIAVVNGSMISANRFQKNYAATLVYYSNLLKSSEGNSTSTAALAKITPTDLQVNVLDQLVVAKLVEVGAKREVGSDLMELVNDKIGDYAKDEKIRNGAERLYGMGFADFRAETLVPQAEMDILSGRLFLRDEDFQTWLADARRSANVRIFSPKFTWDGEKVMANSE